MLRMDEVQGIETVYIPEPDRGTLCISSQVGCAMDCTFCATAQQGFNRNLSVAEIVGQVWLAHRELAADARPMARTITNIVFMGMGEPLANYRNVVPAMRIFMDDLGYDLSRRRVTLSTSGLVPQIYKLAEECNVALAVSLHAPNDALRNELVPINRKHPIDELLAACWHYIDAPERPQRHVRVRHARRRERQARAREGSLARLLRGRPAKLNLIPFNVFPGTRYRCSPAATILRFRDILNEHGVIATTRRTRGDDIDAACGQLAGRVTDRTLGAARHQTDDAAERGGASMRRGAMRLAALPAMLVLMTSVLSACHSSPPAYQQPERGGRKPEPAQAAVANMQLAIEYMKLGNLASARDCIERALAEAPENPDVQDDRGSRVRTPQ